MIKKYVKDVFKIFLKISKGFYIFERFQNFERERMTLNRYNRLNRFYLIS